MIFIVGYFSLDNSFIIKSMGFHRRMQSDITSHSEASKSDGDFGRWEMAADNDALIYISLSNIIEFEFQQLLTSGFTFKSGNVIKSCAYLLIFLKLKHCV